MCKSSKLLSDATFKIYGWFMMIAKILGSHGNGFGLSLRHIAQVGARIILFFGVSGGPGVGPAKVLIVLLTEEDPADAHIANVEVAVAVGTLPSLCSDVEVEVFLPTLASTFESSVGLRPVAEPPAVVLLFIVGVVLASRGATGRLDFLFRSGTAGKLVVR